MSRNFAYRALLATLLLPLAACATRQHSTPQSYTNPILYADYSDPDVIRVGRDYYMVASSFHFSPGLPVLHSRDLVHWEILGHVLPRLPFGPLYDMPGPHTLTDKISKPIGGTKYASGIWAPSIRHHNGLFYAYYPTPDEGIFMSTARNPAGPWSPAVQVIAGPGYEDPCPFWDDDGSAWLIYGKVGAGPLILHRMSVDGTKVLDAGVVVAEDRVRLPVLEGPKLIKRDGWYYIFAPIGGVGTGPQAVGRARDIRGPYEWRDVLVPGGGLAGPHQGGYVETPSGEGWFVHFNSTGAFGRIVHLQPVIWRDGWPVMGDETIPVASHAMPDTGSAPSRLALQDSDEFSSSRLGLQWSWNHNPDNAKWSLSERSGWMRLHAAPAQQIVNARNTLTQILQGPGRRFDTRIDISRMADGQRAGLSLFGVRPAWIGVLKQDGLPRIALSIEGEEQIGEPLSGSTIELRADVREDQTVRYFWRDDAAKGWNSFGDKIPLSRFSWWKGSRPALFTYTRGEGQGSVDVDWFRVSRNGD